MSTATIILTGLVYLAAQPQQTPTVLRAAIMRSEMERVSTRGGVIPQHRAFLRVPQESIQDYGGRKPDLTYAAVGDLGFTEVFFLRNEMIKIEGVSNTMLEFPVLAPPPPNPPPSSKVTFRTAVPRTRNFCPTCHLLSSVDFDAPDLHHVGGRLDIEVGVVTAQALSPCGIWNFDAEFGYPARVEGHMPREVAIDFEVPNQLVLKTSSLPNVETPGPSYTLTFKPGVPVQVVIGSATIEDILRLGTSHDRIDHHFELFYYLLERSNAARHPLPIADPSCTELHRLNGVDCPPVQQ